MCGEVAMCKALTIGSLLVLALSFAVAGYAQGAERPISLMHYQAFQAPALRQTYPLGTGGISGEEQNDEKPPLDAWRVAGEILAGGAGDLAGFVGPILAFEKAFGETDDMGRAVRSNMCHSHNLSALQCCWCLFSWKYG
jgi:hypothetical protein